MSELSCNKPNMKGIASTFFLIGLISEYNNRFQTVADTFFNGISWRQVFVLNCVNFFENPPTIKELAEVIGGSHQNTKQILLKLEKSGFVNMLKDETDGRKQRVVLTKKAIDFQGNCTTDCEDFTKWLFSGIDNSELQTTLKVITQLDDRLKEHQEKNK